MSELLGKRSDALRLGVLGLGNAGRTAIRAASSSEFVTLAGVCDQSATVAQEFASDYSVPSYTSVREFAADPDIEVVYVSTPTFLHLAHALDLAANGKHLMIEKPIVKDPGEGEALIQLAVETGVKIMAVNTRGRDAPIRAIARLVAAGAIGNVLSLTNISYTNWVLRPRYPYELLPALGGGVGFRQAPHQVEIARAITGASVTAVTAIAGSSPVPVPTIGNYSALLEFDGGQSATLVYNGYGFFDTAELTYGFGEGGHRYDPEESQRMRAVKSWSLDKYGESGVSVRERSSTTTPPKPLWSFVGLTLVSGERGDIRQSLGGVTVYDENGSREVSCLDQPGGLSVDFEEFYRAMRFNEALAHGAEWGVNTVRVCDAIWRSHREHRRIEL